MKKIKVLSVFGTRPEAIKFAPVIKLLEKDPKFESVVCVTGQHKEMLKPVMDLFDINANYNLEVMKENQSLAELTGKSIVRIDEVIAYEEPDLVLVHGDTTSTLAGAISAFYNKVKLGHIEAGLRSGNINSPFPEEFNRRITSEIATMHFAPTVVNAQTLLDEGVPIDNLWITGNTVIDALLSVVSDDYSFDSHEDLSKIDFDTQKVILLTAHRRENLGQPMEQIFRAVKRLNEEFKDVKVVFPIHYNPKIRNIANEIFDEGEITIIEPLDYQDFANLINKSHLILTDSGGIQEEAPSLGKPVLVLREETERTEAVELGTVKMVGTQEDAIYREAKELLKSPEKYNAMAAVSNPYGDGKSSDKIVRAIEWMFL